MSFARHFLAAIQVQELIHLRRGQPVSNLKVLYKEHLPGDWVLQEAGVALRLAWRVDFMLKLHLHRQRNTGPS